jgi:tetratricopeptide (TPR) repeat protein
LVKNFHSLMALRRQVRATAPSPERAALRLGMAEIYRDIELFDEAYEEGEEALREDPASAAPARFLGDLYAKQGYHRRALACYRAFLRLDPGDPVVRALADSLSGIAGR